MTGKLRRKGKLVALALLGRPQRLLISARTYVGPVPLDSTAWRVVTLPAE